MNRYDSRRLAAPTLLAALALGGCAAIPAPRYAADHPANAQAASAPVWRGPDALSAYQSPDTAIKTETPQDKTPSMPDMPGMKHDAHGGTP